MKSVTIPSSVTSIGSYAFEGCNGLESVTIPPSVTYISFNAFSGCSGLTGVEIPSSVERIGGFAFYGCSGLTSITIPSGVKVIGDSVFSGCSGLTSITIPSSVKSIMDSAFSGCSRLESVTIPPSVTYISFYAFSGCSGLTGVEIPSSVKEIRSYAFKGCNGLTSVTIPSSVGSIETQAFGYDNSGQKISNFIIYGTSGSEAEAYAERNGFAFQIVSGGDSSQEGANKADIFSADVTLSQTSYPYDGTAKTPSITVKLGGKTLALNTDYTVSYSNNTNVGTAKATVAGKGNYTGSKTVEFTITKAAEEPKKIDISKANVTLSQTSYPYDGTAKTPSVTVKLDGKTLALNTDYTVVYSNNIKAGTAKVTVTGKGNYTGSKSVSFTIVKAAGLTSSNITCKKAVYKVAYGAKPFKINATSKSKMTFTSSKPKIAAVNKNTGRVTIKNTGVATITIKAGKATKKVTVKVSPRKPSVKSAKTAKGRKLTVNWAKDKMASGYQVQISTDKKFKKNVKSKSLPKASYTFTKLKTGKKYYVRIRSYKKSSKETLYSTWSKEKLSNKIKK